MALGSCNYDVNGLFGGCNLGLSKSCFTSVGDVCTAATTLVTMCPLQYGGTGQGCQPPNLITTLINIALKPGKQSKASYRHLNGILCKHINGKIDVQSVLYTAPHQSTLLYSTLRHYMMSCQRFPQF